MSDVSRRFHLWRMPVALGLASAFGLGSALLADGWGDVLSWLTLGWPIAVVLYYGFRRG